MPYLALYIRVSTEEQATDGNSLAEQEQQLQQFAQGNGFTTYQVYKDDGYSAKNLDRPALKRLRAAIRNGEISGVITTRIDRLTRSVGDFARLIEEFNQHNVFYRSTRQNFEIGTAIGRLMATILSAIAEFEREMIGERVYENLQNLFKNGKLPLKPTFGYQLVDGKLTPHPEEARWVRKAASLLLAGHGSRHVAKFLNECGVRSKTGRMWSDAALRTLFHNTSLIGTLTWNQRKGSGKGRTMRDEVDWIVIPNHHEPLLTKEEFGQINRLMARRQSFPARSRNGSRLLSGIAKCGFCGESMSAGWQIYSTKQGRHRHKTYRCSTYVTRGTCVINRVNADELDSLVVCQLLKFRRGTALDAQLSGLLTSDVGISAEISEVKRKIKQFDDRIQRLFDALTLGVVQPVDFQLQRQRLEEEKTKEQARLSELETWRDLDGVSRAEHPVYHRFNRLKCDLDGNATLQRSAILELVHEVKVYRQDSRREESEVEIVYRL